MKNKIFYQLFKLKFLIVALAIISVIAVQAQYSITICPGETAVLNSTISPPIPLTGAAGTGLPPCPPNGSAPGPGGCSNTCRWYIEKTISVDDLVNRVGNSFVVAPLTTTPYLISSRYKPRGAAFPGAPSCQTGQWARETFIVIVEDCDPADKSIFNTYTWLTNFANPTYCNGESVYVYDADTYEFLIVKTNLGENMYNTNGDLICFSPTGGFSFIGLYNESRILDSWHCDTGFQGRESKPEIQDQGIQIFPNPTKDKVFINLQQLTFEQPVISIYDVQGKQVKQIASAAAFAGIVQLNVGDLERGIYLVEVRTSENILTQKLLIQ